MGALKPPVLRRRVIMFESEMVIIEDYRPKFYRPTNKRLGKHILMRRWQKDIKKYNRKNLMENE